MNILVTGSSRGIGKAISLKLLDEGHKVTGTSTSQKSSIDHDSYRHIQCDQNLSSELELLHQEINSNCPDIVINNAGIFLEADIQNSDKDWLESWDKTLQVDLKAPALICKWLINEWRKANINGRIINISSRAAYRGDTQEYAAYAAAKAGLVAFTKSIARNMGEHGITAYSICPGFVHTDMAENSIATYGKEYLTQGLALDNIAPPEQVAELAYFLCTANIEHMTGQTFHINSGSYMI